MSPSHNGWLRATQGYSLWRVKNAVDDLQRQLPVFLGCSCVTEPRYFGNKIRSVNLWFDVSGTIFKGIDSTDFTIPFTGNRENFCEGRVPRDSLQFTASKSLILLLFLHLCRMKNAAALGSPSLHHLPSEKVCTAQINIINSFNRLEGGSHNYSFFAEKRNEAQRS